MLETGWDTSEEMLDLILTLQYTYEEELRDGLGEGIPLMVTKFLIPS